MATYQYVDKAGKIKTIEANDPTSAISSATDIANTSGVSLYSSPSTSTTPPSPTTPTYKTVNLGDYGNTETQSQSDFMGNYDVSQSEQSKIRQDALSRVQDEINAANSAYARLLADTQKAGVGRLGEDTAVQARRGMIGSTFGSALTDKTREYNLGQEKGVLESQAAAIAAINARAEGNAQAEIAARRAAKQGGYTAYQEYQSKTAERKVKALEDIANAFFLQGVSPDSIDPTQLKEVASKMGVSTSDIINSYLGLKEKKGAENKPFEAGGYMYQYNPKTGQYENKGTQYYKPTGSGTSGLTPYQQFSATQSIAKDNQKRTENAREMSRQAQLIKSSYDNITAGGDRSLNTQAIITSFNKILDPTSVVRESEYDRTAEGQSLLAQLKGKYDNIVSGGAGVTEQTLKDAKDIAEAYLTNSAASIKAENDRAMTMAKSFGLNPDFVSATGVIGSQGYGSVKSIEDYRAEFPQATEEELRALMAEEGNL